MVDQVVIKADFTAVTLFCFFFLSFLFSYFSLGREVRCYLIGVFDIDKTHLELTICPRHCNLFGVRWRSNKMNSAAPSSWGSHLSRERGITLSKSVTILTF